MKYIRQVLLMMREEKLFSADELTKQAETADIAVITLGRLSGEFIDRKMADFNLSVSERQLIQQVCDVYHKANKQVVVLGVVHR